MDMSTFTQLIGSLGFPIVACAALYIGFQRERDAHAQEMKEFADALTKNTQVMEKHTLILEAVLQRLGVSDDGK